MKRFINNFGSVDDIKCSLCFVEPKNPSHAKADLKYLQDSLADEKKNKNRATVLKMIQGKINSIKKKYQPYLQD